MKTSVKKKKKKKKKKIKYDFLTIDMTVKEFIEKKKILEKIYI